MLIAFILTTLMLMGLYLSPNIRNLTEKKALQSVYHILAVLLILFSPILIMTALGLPVYIASMAGKFTVYLGIPLLVFVGIKKLRARNKNQQPSVAS